MTKGAKIGEYLTRYLVAALLVAAIALILEPFALVLSSTTVALAFLLGVLIVATFLGRNPALMSSLASMLCFNYFFLPPIHTWRISESQNLIAWGAFTVTAIIAGELSSYARRRAAEAERLYEELQSAFAAKSQAEALTQSEKLKSALLDAVTHDLKTPLTSIKASITMLLKDTELGSDEHHLTNDGRTVLLEVINEESDRLNRFVESMMDVAKFEGGEKSIQVSRITIDELVRVILARVRYLAKEHKLQVEVSCPDTAVNVDTKAVCVAVHNLVENAVKYSPLGSSITLAIACGGDLLVSVEDAGNGVPAGQREAVFRKFHRLEGNAKGFGMGLAIVAAIAEAHRGRAWVEDGKIGAKFVLAFPMGDNGEQNEDAGSR